MYNVTAENIGNYSQLLVLLLKVGFWIVKNLKTYNKNKTYYYKRNYIFNTEYLQIQNTKKHEFL